jgi:hypothetical protein
MTVAHPLRHRLRRYPLDGAELWFHPRTGTHVRVDALELHDRRRVAPRVVMFGITNACNLACSYCSRDAGKPSTWTVDAAAELLEDLAAAGVLEVAFGGGEPFAFRGFAELLSRLYRTTPLALHATTNGTLLTDELLATVAPMLGQVRLSLHENVAWRAAAVRLQAAGVRWGPNVLVDARTIAELPALLAEVQALGASDVSLLSYVGPDPARHPSAADLARCADLVRASPLPCRISVCFGQRLGVDRLLAGVEPVADCAAGIDFVTVTPDRRLQACSFQDDGLPFVDAADLLQQWRARHVSLLAPSRRRGCARLAGGAPAVAMPSVAAGVRVWQAFSGNNSSECDLVARFADSASAAQLVARLTGLPLGRESDPIEADVSRWLEWFRREGTPASPVHPSEAFEPPSVVAALGPVFFAHNGMTLGTLRLLEGVAWQAGAECWSSRIWSGEVVGWLVAWNEGTAPAAAAAAAGAVAADDLGTLGAAVAHGSLVVGWWCPRDRRFDEGLAALRALAAPAELAFEPVRGVLDAALLQGLLRRAAEPTATCPRLWMRFPAGAAARFAPTVDDRPFVQSGDSILVDGIEQKQRLALRAHAVGGSAIALEGRRIEVKSEFGRPGERPWVPSVLPAAAIERLQMDLRLRLGGDACEIVSQDVTQWAAGPGTVVRVRSDRPLPVIETLDAFARSLALVAEHELLDVDQPALALRRLLAATRH